MKRMSIAILGVIATLIVLSGVYILYLSLRPLILQTTYPQPIQLNSSQYQSSITIPTDLNGILTQADNINTGIESDIYNLGLTNDQTQKIVQYKQRSTQYKQEALTSSDYNKSLLYAYYALWYSYTAKYAEANFQLMNCVNQTQDLINTHNNSLCYVMELSSYNELTLDNKSVNAYPFYAAENYYTIDSIRIQIQNQYYSWFRVYDRASTCPQNLYTVVNNTFNFQKPYCDAKEKAVSFFGNFPYLLVVIFGILVGLILENRFDVLKTAREQSDIADKKLNIWWRSVSAITKRWVAIVIVLFVGVILLIVYSFLPPPVTYLLAAFFIAIISFLLKQIHDLQKPRRK